MINSLELEPHNSGSNKIRFRQAQKFKKLKGLP